MASATWVLVVITAAYVALTGALVWIGRRQLVRQSNPVAAARIRSATVKYGSRGTFLDSTVEVRILGGSPAINVKVSGELKLLTTDTSAARPATFRWEWETLPMLAVEETHSERVEWLTPGLGEAGRDDVEVPIFLSITTKYFDTTARDYVSLFVASPVTLRTPEHPTHSRGVALGAGVFHSQARPRTPFGRARMRWRQWRSRQRS